jgi:hypothetical protein
MVAKFNQQQLGHSENTATPGSIPQGSLVEEILGYDAEKKLFYVRWKVPPKRACPMVILCWVLWAC